MRPFILCLALLLGACQATQTVDTTGAAKAAYAARSAYESALVAAVAYNRLPQCPTTIVCRDPVVVAKLRTLSADADAATKAAENTVRQAGASPMAIQLAVVAAQQSVQAMTLILPAGK